MSDDLDALLDEALDVMDQNDKELEQEREAMAAKLLEEQQQKQQEEYGASGDEAGLLQAVTSLLEVLKQGPEAMENAPEGEVERIQQMLQKTLGGMREGATSEELESIDKCQQLLSAAHEAGNEDTSPEQLEEMMKALREATAVAGDSSHTAEGGKESSAEPTQQEGLQHLMDLLANEQKGRRTADGPQSPPGDDAEASPATALMDDDREALRLFLEILKPDAITESFRAMANVFPTWFEKYGPTVSDEDRRRFESQHKKMLEVLDIVSEGALQAVLNEDATDEDRLRLNRFTSSLEELQALGMPPQTLVEMVQHK